MEPDPLLDRPSWAPSWVPTVDDLRHVRLLGWALVALFAAGFTACVARGADNPADPVVTDIRGVGDLAGVFGTVLVDIVTAAGELTELCLLDADTAEERARGLKEVTDLEGYDGMLFRNAEEVQTQFVMVDTVTPLTISWWAGDGTFVSGTDMVPCAEADPADCQRYSPAGPYRWAIEVPQSALPEAAEPGSTMRVGNTGCRPLVD